jgi:hypothetical protein
MGLAVLLAAVLSELRRCLLKMIRRTAVSEGVSHVMAAPIRARN